MQCYYICKQWAVSVFYVNRPLAEEETYLFVLRMSANVAVMTTGTQFTSSCFNLFVERIGYTFAYCLLFAVSLTGNALIGIVVYKTRSLRNPVNYFIANMAISDLLFLIFLIPQVLVQLNTNTWLIDGSLGQALCKLFGYLVDVSSVVFI